MIGKVIDSISGQKVEFPFFPNLEISTDGILIIFLTALIFDIYYTAYIGKYFLEKLSFDIYKNYIKNIFYKVIHYPTSFFKSNAMGKITYSITNGSDTLRRVSISIGSVFGTPIEILVSLFFIYLVSPAIFYFSLINFFLYVSVFYFTKNKTSILEENYNNKKKIVSQGIIEKINLALEVKKNNKEKEETKTIETVSLKNEEKAFEKKIIFDMYID
jgi:ATP-binding cassette subfamily B protein